MFKAQAMIHSTETLGTVTVHEKTGSNEYTVETPAGVFCKAIYNPFTGLYYADDKYAVIKKEDKDND